MNKIVTAVLLLCLATLSYAGGSGHMATVKSKHSVAETMDRVEKAAKAQGMTVYARIDFAQLGEKNGVKIPANQLLIFGKGKGGPKLISEAPSAALDLPLKIAAWQDKSGAVMLGYVTATAIKDRHNIKKKDKVIGKINERLKSIVDEALK